MKKYTAIDKLRTKKALEQFVQEYFGGDYAAFISDASRRINKLLLADLAEAERLVASLRRVKRFFSSKLRPRISAIEARLLHRTGQSRNAAVLYAQAVQAMIRHREFTSAAQTRVGLMDVYMYLGEHGHALETGKKALRHFRRKGEKTKAARVLTNIGNIYHRLDKNSVALRYYDSAREIFASEGGMPLAIVDFNRANILANLNRLDEAEELYADVAERFRKEGAALTAEQARYSLAYLYFLRSKYSESMATFEDVLRQFEKLGDKKSAAVTQLDLSEINIHLGQFSAAAVQADEVKNQFGRLGMRYEAAKAAYFAAEASLQFGDLTSASSYLRSAHSQFAHEKNDLWLGMTTILGSRLDRAKGEHSGVLAKAKAAKALFAKAGDIRRKSEAELELARVEFECDRIPNAIRRLNRLTDSSLTVQQMCDRDMLLGECYEAKDEPDTALGYYKKSIKSVERMLVDLYPDEIQHFFLLNNYNIYLKAVNCLISLGKPEESFVTNARALSLLNRQWSHDVPLEDLVPAKLLETRDALRATLRELQTADPGGFRSVVAHEDSRKLENALWQNERSIRSHVYSAGYEIPTLTADVDYGKSLKTGELMLNFVYLDDNIGTYIVSNQKTQFVPSSIDRSEFLGILRELHFLLENSIHEPKLQAEYRDDLNEYLRFFYRNLIDPLPLDGESLILLLEGDFCQIPFAALIDEKGNSFKDLFDYSIVMNPDSICNRGNDLKKLHRLHSAVFAQSTSRLPLAKSEAEFISGLFRNARCYSDVAATTHQLRQELNSSNGFVHIAAHASRSSDNPLFSRILMRDGPLFPFDLFGTGIRSKLVVLSGCQTAAPGIYYGNSFSLAGAFHQAGAQYVLASLWTVSDKITMAFMQFFYMALSKSHGIAASYKYAMDKTMKINGNPAFWAPFVLLGI